MFLQYPAISNAVLTFLVFLGVVTGKALALQEMWRHLNITRDSSGGKHRGTARKRQGITGKALETFSTRESSDHRPGAWRCFPWILSSCVWAGFDFAPGEENTEEARGQPSSRIRELGSRIPGHLGRGLRPGRGEYDLQSRAVSPRDDGK